MCNSKRHKRGTIGKAIKIPKFLLQSQRGRWTIFSKHGEITLFCDLRVNKMKLSKITCITVFQTKFPQFKIIETIQILNKKQNFYFFANKIHIFL